MLNLTLFITDTLKIIDAFVLFVTWSSVAEGAHPRGKVEEVLRCPDASRG